MSEATYTVSTATELYVYVLGRLVLKVWRTHGTACLMQVAPCQSLYMDDKCVKTLGTVVT